jgi:AcrR family transcriptional regulator
MARQDSRTRLHILDVAVKMLSDVDSGELRITAVSKEAEVASQTIYYHFDSLGRLIAEAQAATYLRMVSPLHGFLFLAEKALANGDETAFWSAIGDDIMLSWSYGFGEEKWKITRLLIDIWSDEKTQKEFCVNLNIQFERWVKVLESAKVCGWADEDLDTYALIASCWGASNGQSLFSGTSIINYTPETMRDFWIEIAMAKG